MAIPENITAALAGNKEVLEFVTGLDARASKLTPDIEAELPKFGEYKAHSVAIQKILAETKAKDADSLLSDFKNLKAVNTDLLAQKDKWKADGKGVESAEYRALLEQIEANKKETDGIKTELQTAKEAAAKADAAKRETDLKSSLVSEALKLKARAPEDEFLLLKAKGLIGFKEDGSPFFNKINADGKPVAVANAAELMAWHLGNDKSKIDPSGKSGPGAQHGGSGGDGSAAPKTREEARAAFRATHTNK